MKLSLSHLEGLMQIDSDRTDLTIEFENLDIFIDEQNDLDKRLAQRLGRVLQHANLPKNRTIEIDMQRIGCVTEKGAAFLSNIFTSHECPAKLHFINNNEEVFVALVNALVNSECRSDITLILIENNIGMAGLNALIRARARGYFSRLGIDNTTITIANDIELNHALESGFCPPARIHVDSKEGAKALAHALVNGHCPSGLSLVFFDSVDNLLIEEDDINIVTTVVTRALASGRCPSGLRIKFNWLTVPALRELGRALTSGDFPSEMLLDLSNRGNELTGSPLSPDSGIHPDMTEDRSGITFLADALASGCCPPGLQIDLGDNFDITVLEILIRGLKIAVEEHRCPERLRVHYRSDIHFTLPEAVLAEMNRLLRVNDMWHMRCAALSCVAFQQGVRQFQQGTLPAKAIPPFIDQIYKYVIPESSNPSTTKQVLKKIKYMAMKTEARRVLTAVNSSSTSTNSAPRTAAAASNMAMAEEARRVASVSAASSSSTLYGNNSTSTSHSEPRPLGSVDSVATLPNGRGSVRLG